MFCHQNDCVFVLFHSPHTMWEMLRTDSPSSDAIPFSSLASDSSLTYYLWKENLFIYFRVVCLWHRVLYAPNENVAWIENSPCIHSSSSFSFQLRIAQNQESNAMYFFFWQSPPKQCAWIIAWMRCASYKKVSERECKSWRIYTAKKMTYILNEINLQDFSLFVPKGTHTHISRCGYMDAGSSGT